MTARRWTRLSLCPTLYHPAGRSFLELSHSLRHAHLHFASVLAACGPTLQQHAAVLNAPHARRLRAETRARTTKLTRRASMPSSLAAGSGGNANAAQRSNGQTPPLRRAQSFRQAAAPPAAPPAVPPAAPPDAAPPDAASPDAAPPAASPPLTPPPPAAVEARRANIPALTRAGSEPAAASRVDGARPLLPIKGGGGAAAVDSGGGEGGKQRAWGSFLFGSRRASRARGTADEGGIGGGADGGGEVAASTAAEAEAQAEAEVQAEEDEESTTLSMTSRFEFGAPLQEALQAALGDSIGDAMRDAVGANSDSAIAAAPYVSLSLATPSTPTAPPASVEAPPEAAASSAPLTPDLRTPSPPPAQRTYRRSRSSPALALLPGDARAALSTSAVPRSCTACCVAASSSAAPAGTGAAEADSRFLGSSCAATVTPDLLPLPSAAAAVPSTPDTRPVARCHRRGSSEPLSPVIRQVLIGGGGGGCGGRGGVQVASSGTGGADGGTTATAPAAAPTSAPAASSQADPFDSLDMDMEELLLTPWRRLGQYPLRRWLGQPASPPLATVPRRRSKRLRPLPCIAARSAASAA